MQEEAASPPQLPNQAWRAPFTLPPLRAILPDCGPLGSGSQFRQSPSSSYTHSQRDPTSSIPIPEYPAAASLAATPPHTSHKRKRSLSGSSAQSIQQSLIPNEQISSSWSWQASVALTPRYGCSAVNAAAARFYQELQCLQINEKKNNVLVTSQIHLADITTLTRFFFHDVFGAGCQKRMFLLLDAIALQNPHHKSTATIAAEKATDTTLPTEVQVFFADYSRWHMEEAKHVGIESTVANTVRSFELYNSFFQLREKAVGPAGGQLQEFLREQGFTTSVGVDIRTCILKYLSRELHIAPGQLNNALQAQQGIFQLAQQFGKGILVLLPKIASHRYVHNYANYVSQANFNRITRIGTQKMQRITQILFNTLPEAVEICSAAELLIPYTQKNPPLPPPQFLGQQVTLRPGLSLLEIFTLIRSANTAPLLLNETLL